MLANKVAIVTGSTSGIGRAIALKLADQGAKVMINGFGDPSEIDALVAELGTRSSQPAFYCDADMTDPTAIAAMVARTEAEFGAVDILVNNAGIQFVSPVEEFPIDKWNAIIAINLSSAFHTTRAVVPGMKSRGLGAHHQFGLGPFQDSLAIQVGLCRRQTRARRFDQICSAGAGRERNYRQRRVAGLCSDVDGGTPNIGHSQSARHYRGRG